MDTNLLIMCKLMYLLLLMHGFYGYLDEPFLPFLTIFEVAEAYPGIFGGTLKIGFLLSGTFLLLNYRVRWMSLMLGMVILLALLSSKPLFRNHLFICSAAFILAGLSEKNRTPWLLYVQLSLVYFGAFTNKIMQADWWNGQFMDNWLLAHHAAPLYGQARDLFPDLLLARILSVSSMLVELLIATLLLYKKKHKIAVWFILIFHTLLFSVTEFRFGHFFEDILIYLLVFLDWPKERVIATRKAGRLRFLEIMSSTLNWNREIEWEQQPMESRAWLQIACNNKQISNMKALRALLLYSPGFYFVLFLTDSLIRYLFLHPMEHYISMILFWGGLVFFLPIRWDELFRIKYWRRSGLLSRF